VRSLHTRRHLVILTAFACWAAPLSAAPSQTQTAAKESPDHHGDKAKPSAETAKAPDVPAPPPLTGRRALYRTLIEDEAKKAGLPPDVAESVVRVESNFDPSVVGSVGEIGLMQVRPATAAMMGFHGTSEDLAKPEVNIHYGVTYLGRAWRLANGDLCRALMKYRAGHGEEVMSPLSATYCNRARGHLAAIGSALGAGFPPTPVSTNMPAFVAAQPKPSLPKPVLALVSPVSVYAHYKQGTKAASNAFWKVQEARVRAITARLQTKWHMKRLASR